METTGKKVLLILTYYTLMLAMVGLAIFLFISLPSDRLDTWVKIVYYILVGLLIALVVFDIICTNTKMNKYISGFILYGLTIAHLVVSFILYTTFATNGVVPADVMDIFMLVLLVAWAINILTIVIYCVGEHLVVISSAQNKRKIV